MSLKKQTFSGIIWTFLDTFFVSGVSFVAMIYLARVLGPEDFGLIGMISVFIAIGVSLIDSGLSASIIRTKDADNSDFSTVFYLNIAMSFFVYIIVFLSAPLIADFFNQEILINIVRLYCFSFIISAFSSIQLAQLNREMRFKRIMIFNIPSTLISITIGIILSLTGYGVWSIVWMHLSKQLVLSLLVWFFSKWKPTLHFSREKMKYHYGFGYKLMLSGILNTAFDNIYNIIIGKIYSVQTLGFFERARTFNIYPVSILTGVISKVTYPLLSKIQNEKERVSKVYKELIQFSFSISAPLMLGAAAVAYPLFELVLGTKWLPAVPYFQILCFGSMLLPIHSFNLTILKVFGKSNLFLKLEIYKKVLTALTIIISLPFGILGLLWGSVLVSFIALLINTHYSQKLINYKTTEQLVDMIPTIIISSGVAILMYRITLVLQDSGLCLQLMVSSIIGIVLYISIHFLLKTKSMVFAVELLNNKKL